MRYGILGPLEARSGAGPLHIGSWNERALLARLLLAANRVVPLDVLIEDVWAGAPPVRANVAVRVHLSRLRKTLGAAGAGEAIRTQSPGYLIELNPADELDAARFEELVSRGRDALAAGEAEAASGALAEALALWRGPVLADLADFPFFAVDAVRLEEMRLAATAEIGRSVAT